jgi:hypothetical protein
LKAKLPTQVLACHAGASLPSAFALSSTYFPLVDWKEDYFAELKHTGFVGVTFTNGDKKIVFYTLGGEMVFAFSKPSA